jgi:BirA family biotin operon repressor/biotin-[acetyl-CoA-carboxylase] ligase
MSVRDGVLDMLANGGERVVSGSYMASELGVSRAAVWKAVQRLQESGYVIDGAPNRGYLLRGAHDVLTERGIGLLWDEPLRSQVSLQVKEKTESTNDDIRRIAEQGAPAFSVVAASQQTAGKGRRGRAFFSPAHSGVYLSLLVRPQGGMAQASSITCAAAVAVCRAVEQVASCEAHIKWVNDVYVGGRKVCGILTEGAADLETGGLRYAVVGIGVNAYAPEGGFPPDIAMRAGAIMDTVTPNARNRMAAAIVSEFSTLYNGKVYDTFVAEYQRRSMMPGRNIVVLSPSDGERRARAVRVNDDLSLRVRYQDGTTEDIRSGEVHIILEQE